MKITIIIMLLSITVTTLGQTIYSDPMEKNEIGFADLLSIKHALKIGKDKKKRVLIYFSGYAVVNARKIEENILMKEGIKNMMIEKFVCFIAYVDDKKKDKLTQSTIGEKYSKIQVDNFHTNLQPFFCILDEKGKVLSQIGYVNNAGYFMTFLTDGLK